MDSMYYLFKLSEDLELQLDGSFRGSRVPLLGTELNDFVDGGPECQLLVVLLLSTYRLSPTLHRTSIN